MDITTLYAHLFLHALIPWKHVTIMECMENIFYWGKNESVMGSMESNLLAKKSHSICFDCEMKHEETLLEVKIGLG